MKTLPYVVEKAQKNPTSEINLDVFFHLSSDLFCAIGLEGKFNKLNPACTSILGWNPSELEGISWIELVHPEDVAISLAVWQHMDPDGSCQLENRYQHQDGSYRSLSWSFSRSDSGPIYAVAKDVSDRTAAAAEQERLCNVVEVSLNEIYIFNPDTFYFEYVNAGARRNLGYSLQELYRLTPLDLQPDWDEAAFQSLIAPLRDRRQEKLVFQTLHRRKNGSIYPVEVHLQLIEQNDSALFLGVLQDITERQKVESALRLKEAQLQQKAQQLEESIYELQRTQAHLIQSEKMSSLGQLVAGIAHEINNPVNFIYGNLTHVGQYSFDLLGLLRLYQQEYPIPTPIIQEEIEAMDLEFLMTDLPKILNSMKVGAERIREIVLSLRNFSRVDEAEVKAVEIHEGIDSTLTILQNRLKAKGDCPGIKVIKQYGKLPKVGCYPGQLNQVFMNIIVNAIEALETEPEPRLIAITTTLGCQDVPSVIVRIADNGPGITSEVKQRLFDPFFTTKPIGKGTGLGLAISYSIAVEKHQGQLSCISVPGEGTEFVIEIPIQQQELPQTSCVTLPSVRKGLCSERRIPSFN